MVTEAAESCEYNAESGDVSVCWLHVCPGFIYSVSQESCTDMSFEASYYSTNPWVFGSCEEPGSFEFLGPQVCSYARLALMCDSPSTCAANFKFESRFINTAVALDPPISGESLKLEVFDVDPVLFATCTVLRADSLSQNDGCLGRTDYGVEVFSVTPCSNGRYESEGYVITGGSEFSVVIYAYEDFNVDSEADDIYTILAQETTDPVLGGEKGAVEFYLDPLQPGGFVSGIWLSNVSMAFDSYIRVTGSSAEGTFDSG